MSSPLVYAAIAAISAKLSKRGIAKTRDNSEGGFKYRGIDDIYAGLAPLLAKHKLCVLPRVIERHCVERTSRGGDAVFQVAVRVAFDFVAVDDGSTHTVETYGEAIDDGDKATAKAMSAAYKYAAMQAFCIPTGEADADKNGQRVRATTMVDEAPVQGWAQWVADICDMVGGCETEEAVTRLQQTYRRELRGLATADKELFSSIGARFQEKRSALSQLKTATAEKRVATLARRVGGPKPEFAGRAAVPSQAENVVDASA